MCPESKVSLYLVPTNLYHFFFQIFFGIKRKHQTYTWNGWLSHNCYDLFSELGMFVCVLIFVYSTRSQFFSHHGSNLLINKGGWMKWKIENGYQHHLVFHQFHLSPLWFLSLFFLPSISCFSKWSHVYVVGNVKKWSKIHVTFSNHGFIYNREIRIL